MTALGPSRKRIDGRMRSWCCLMEQLKNPMWSLSNKSFSMSVPISLHLLLLSWTCWGESSSNRPKRWSFYSRRRRQWGRRRREWRGKLQKAGNRKGGGGGGRVQSSFHLLWVLLLLLFLLLPPVLLVTMPSWQCKWNSWRDFWKSSRNNWQSKWLCLPHPPPPPPPPPPPLPLLSPLPPSPPPPHHLHSQHLLQNEAWKKWDFGDLLGPGMLHSSSILLLHLLLLLHHLLHLLLLLLLLLILMAPLPAAIWCLLHHKEGASWGDEEAAQNSTGSPETNRREKQVRQWWPDRQTDIQVHIRSTPVIHMYTLKCLVYGTCTCTHVCTCTCKYVLYWMTRLMKTALTHIIMSSCTCCVSTIMPGTCQCWHIMIGWWQGTIQFYSCFMYTHTVLWWWHCDGDIVMNGCTDNEFSISTVCSYSWNGGRKNLHSESNPSSYTCSRTLQYVHVHVPYYILKYMPGHVFPSGLCRPDV